MDEARQDDTTGRTRSEHGLPGERGAERRPQEEDVYEGVAAGQGGGARPGPSSAKESMKGETGFQGEGSLDPEV